QEWANGAPNHGVMIRPPEGGSGATRRGLFRSMEYPNAGQRPRLIVETTPPPPPPFITSFTPTSGPVGTVVTIDGGNLADASEVRFNLTPASFTVISGSQIQATVPDLATTGRILVLTPAGTAA